MKEPPQTYIFLLIVGFSVMVMSVNKLDKKVILDDILTSTRKRKDIVWERWF